jgi:hypothetical protein
MKTHTHTHTPGPWSVSNGLSTVWANDGERQIADCDKGPLRSAGEDLANARLIAAAPELLAALREIESKLTALLCDRVLDSTLPEFYEVRDARNSARAAISKAEGNA